MRRGLTALPTALLICAIGLRRYSPNLGRRNNRGTDWDDRYLTGDGPPPPPTTTSTSTAKYFWEREGSSCIHVDDVCGHGSGWFYGPSSGHREASLHQPSILLVQNYSDLIETHIYLDGLMIDGRIRFSVNSSSSTTRHGNYDDSTCSYSPVPNHLVVQSAYNDMMGEFYSRTILGLNRWMRDFPTSSHEDVQTYIHFIDRRKGRILEGHELFLGGLPNNGIFDSFAALMPKNDTCQCYERLIFCGYVVKDGITTTSMIDADEGTIIFAPGQSITNPKTDKLDWRDAGDKYRILRTELIDTYSRKWPDLNERIVQYQKRILIQRGIILNDDPSDVIDWKIVGLTHRRARRVWLNIDDVVTTCNEKFRLHRIVCITINVEAAKSAEEQLLMHRSLHAVVGVHGAQLTQAILLPTHAYVLELLPWVPYYLWGEWVTTTHVPTPLGVIFTGTDLNHVGHPLGRDSVPLCLHVNSSDVEADRLCLMNQTSGVMDRFRWADRDYIVSPRTIEEFVSTFLLNDDDTICDEMRKRAERTSFVLYNAFCKSGGSPSTFIAQQYYREKNWMLPKKPHDMGQDLMIEKLNEGFLRKKRYPTEMQFK
ncbi:hypothetical protein ACHAXA_009511 [Cyclostephanos tholiformis]|uniref:Glycosyltransferase 61 catalytic domain-containing protein n=1 Tax=Cyclostephanos tholiformis TaxID=382380 RepID=A0ABD3RYA5_9STRA